MELMSAIRHSSCQRPAAADGRPSFLYPSPEQLLVSRVNAASVGDLFHFLKQIWLAPKDTSDVSFVLLRRIGYLSDTERSASTGVAILACYGSGGSIRKQLRKV